MTETTPNNLPLKKTHPSAGATWSIPGFMHTWFRVTQLRQVALL